MNNEVDLTVTSLDGANLEELKKLNDLQEELKKQEEELKAVKKEVRMWL